ncbi:hypothetical protein [Parafrankia sp. FMc2]|uniref:PD-(D/E)XK nuclease domain-containing protein n=1 Tax=Parafrankia sp. FMc2 TaxID=3233196 RepID=UPI0034D4A4CF
MVNVTGLEDPISPCATEVSAILVSHGTLTDRVRLLIEIKYARKASDFKDIEKQVMEDSVAYLANTDSYDKILVFIYDDSSSSEHHDTTRRALIGIENVTDVIIASRPGRIPPRNQRP